MPVTPDTAERLIHDLVATTSNWQLGRTLASGESFESTLTQAGTYRYVCDPHSSFMKGSFRVG